MSVESGTRLLLRCEGMIALTTLEFGDLRIEPRQVAPGTAIEAFWRGRSDDRHPGRTIGPYFGELLQVARGGKVAVHLHFETVELINSSTITAIIQIIQQARALQTELVIFFDPAKNWQKLSFEALSVFEKDDGLLKIVGEPRQ